MSASRWKVLWFQELNLVRSGITGLTVSNKQILEEANRLFQFPQFTKVVNEMKNDTTVASALLAYKTLIGRVDWNVEACWCF